MTASRLPVILGALVSLAFPAGSALAQRLPPDVVTLHYQLTLAPDFTTDSFTGDVTIDLEAAKPTTRVTLNAVDLEIHDAYLLLPFDRRVQPTWSVERDRETVTFSVTRRLPAGRFKLHIDYEGKLGADMRGFYLARAGGRKYAVTQFESTDARRAFPCFDEPGFKASFTIAAMVDERDTAISNGRVLSDVPGPKAGKHTLHFATTPKMSTYLAALVVGDFQCVSGSADNVTIRVCAVPAKKELGRFALEAAETFLRFYDRYFSVRYPFGKLDLVAAPEFSGAMENTGAIFFSEHDLLIDEAASSSRAQATVAGVIAHEMAHQWFGDLVTMRWWDDLWLNEGFATWMASKPIMPWKPQWHAELGDAQSAEQAMETDALRSTRAVRTEPRTTAEIDEAFDAIAYNKAAAVLQMVEGYVGEEAFRAGVNAYLRSHAYGSATGEDFWTAVATASGKPVDRLMPGFVTQPGVPLVSVEARCESADRTLVDLKQQPFGVGRLDAAAAAGAVWQIPVEIRAIEGTTPGAVVSAVLASPRQTVTLPGCSTTVFANAGARGYYRTAYASDALARLAAARDRLTPAERVRLLGDEWALVEAGRHAVGDYLALVEALAGDQVPEVIDQASKGVYFVHDHLLTPANRESFEAWVRRVFGPRAASVGWSPSPGETEATRELRAALLRLVGAAGRDPDVLGRASSIFASYLDGSQPIEPALLPVVADLALLSADGDLFTRLRPKLDLLPLADRSSLLESVASFGSPAVVDRALAYAVSDDAPREEAPGWISAGLANGGANATAWNWVKTHWNEIERKGGGAALPAVVAGAAAFCDGELRDDLARFLRNKGNDASRAVQQSLERIDTCRDVRLQQSSRLAEWLRAVVTKSDAPKPKGVP